MPVIGVYIVSSLAIKLSPAYLESSKLYDFRVFSIYWMNKKKVCFSRSTFSAIDLELLCRGTARREISPTYQWRLARVGFCCYFSAIPSNSVLLDAPRSQAISPFGALSDEKVVDRLFQ